MIIDLHVHSSASDGKLTPPEVLALAAEVGVGVLALTDHDTVAGYAALPANAAVVVVSGVEFSTRWSGCGIHLVGLNVDLASAALANALAHQTAARRARAESLARRLAERGIAGALDGATSLARGGAIGRVHFAEYLVRCGTARSVEHAFRRYLSDRLLRASDVEWAGMAQLIDWIRAAGGVAVLAHPAKYRLSRSRLEALVSEFRACGGAGLEVISGWQAPATTRDLAALAKRHELKASIGSDFHQRGQSWAALGRLPALPADVEPVWARWPIANALCTRAQNERIA